MGDSHNEANVFAIPKFWAGSKWLEQLDREGSASFFTTNFQDLDTIDTSLIKPVAPDLEPHGFFKQPVFDGPPETIREPPQPSIESVVPVRGEHDTYDVEDVWLSSVIPRVAAPVLNTWDAFHKGTQVAHQPMFVSEAGSGAFDAMLCSPSDHLRLENASVPIVHSRAYFVSLLALAVGRESMLFHKIEAKPYLQARLPEMRISGYSKDVLLGLEKDCCESGCMVLELRKFVETTYAKSSSASGIALASVLDQILQEVQEHITVRGGIPRSLLHLKSAVANISAILKPFHDLASRLSRNHTDEEVISLVFDLASSADIFDEHVRGVMREVLQRVSQPWTEFIEEWIGTQPEQGTILSQSRVGSSKGFVRVQTEVYTDDSGQDVEDVDFALYNERLPHFMPLDLAESIFETGRNLRFIRSLHPDHPLASDKSISSSRPPRAEWTFDWESVVQLETRVSQYRDNLLQALASSKTGCLPLGKEHTELDKRELDASNVFFGVDQGQMDRRILASMQQLSRPISRISPRDRLSTIVEQRLMDSPHSLSASESKPHPSLLPILSFGGIALAQSQVVNRESLRLLFASHDLKEHIRIQRDFHLLGNGLFCSRLSHALFDPDLETAERQAGVARQGGTMGLRLGGRDTWPPASSELRLALMGVLTDTYEPRSETCRHKQHTVGSDISLPGDLSFAVRDLSSEEINKCMEPSSLEALDFLRLSYKPPEELKSILTPVILLQYDSIFRLLLRVLRMVFVTDQLWFATNTKDGQLGRATDASRRFVREARHFVSSIATYFLDTGVAVPWEVFEKRLGEIEAEVSGPWTSNVPDGNCHGPDQVRQLHGSVLNRIMLALFLRKRQRPVMKLLEEILNMILQFASQQRVTRTANSLQIEPHGSHTVATLYLEFRKKVQVFITVCRGLTEKSRLGARKDDDDWLGRQNGLGDEHIVAQLLIKLDMFDYSSRQR